MFIQNTNYKKFSKKLSFYITIAFLVLGLSILSTMAGEKLIGSGGGEIHAGYESSLIVPEGALTNETLIVADSLEEIITSDGDEATILSELNTAISLLDSQDAYINGLSTKKNHPSGEWMAKNHVDRLLRKTRRIKEPVMVVWTKHNGDSDQRALGKTDRALYRLGETDAHIDYLVAQGKLGTVARDSIRASLNGTRAALETIRSLHYETLLFEFGPHGTEFLVPAELVVPWDTVIYSDDLFWYSGDGGEVVDIIDLDYWIDDVNGTVHFYIDHFSVYYYPRR